MTLEEAAAHLEIQQVLYRYCRGVDRGDAALIASVYHPGAVDNHGAWKGLGSEFGDYLVPSMDAVGLTGQHHITNTLIQLRGKMAYVESYFIAYHPHTVDGAAHLAFVAGRYLDVFECRDGAWKISDRRVVIDISRAVVSGEDWAGAASFPGGGRREVDPSSAFFSRSIETR